jgi:hypothetical protein
MRENSPAVLLVLWQMAQIGKSFQELLHNTQYPFAIFLLIFMLMIFMVMLLVIIMLIMIMVLMMFLVGQCLTPGPYWY